MTHMHTWIRGPEDQDFRPCECSAAPPPFVTDLPRGKAAADNGWPDWVSFSGERADAPA